MTKQAGRNPRTKIPDRRPASAGVIRVGIGGWSYPPWRETFYPSDLPQSRALEYASRKFGAIEINSTFYGSQKPATFAKWHAQTPDGFVFAVKAPRVATHRRNLDDASASVERFLESGLDRLEEKLGPILWQFPPTQRFDAAAFAGFFERLPARLNGRVLHHAVDVRDASFADPAFVTLARSHQIAISFTDAEGMPVVADPTSDFIYLRLRRARPALTTGYAAAALKQWADDAIRWSLGAMPGRFDPIAEPAPVRARDTFVFFINGAKERAPAAATRLMELL